VEACTPSLAVPDLLRASTLHPTKAHPEFSLLDLSFLEFTPPCNHLEKMARKRKGQARRSCHNANKNVKDAVAQREQIIQSSQNGDSSNAEGQLIPNTAESPADPEATMKMMLERYNPAPNQV
jgi:hypothetical protein